MNSMINDLRNPSNVNAQSSYPNLGIDYGSLPNYAQSQPHLAAPSSMPPDSISFKPTARGGFEPEEMLGDSDEDASNKSTTDRKSGRRKIKIEYIQDKSRRHITFSKRKAGIMKKAYELSTLTGTQILLLVVSETGLVYTFTTPKLQPLVTQSEGKNLIQSCLNAPDSNISSMSTNIKDFPNTNSSPFIGNNVGGFTNFNNAQGNSQYGSPQLGNNNFNGYWSNQSNQQMDKSNPSLPNHHINPNIYNSIKHD